MRVRIGAAARPCGCVRAGWDRANHHRTTGGIKFPAIFFLLLAIGFAQGGVILTNGTPNTGGGNDMIGWIEANSFSLGAAASITSVDFEVGNFGGTTFQSTVTWFIYADSSGSPGTQLATGSAAVSPVDLGPALLMNYEAFDISFNLNSPFSAAANTTYWLGLHDGPLSYANPNTVGWVYGPGGSATGMSLASPYNGSWNSNFESHYFQLSSGSATAAPEPGSLALMSAGLLAALAAGRSRRRSSPRVF